MEEASTVIRSCVSLLLLFVLLATVRSEAAEASRLDTTMSMGEDMYEELELHMESHAAARMLASSSDCGTRFVQAGRVHYRCGNLVQYSPCVPCSNKAPPQNCGAYNRNCHS